MLLLETADDAVGDIKGHLGMNFNVGQIAEAMVQISSKTLPQQLLACFLQRDWHCRFEQAKESATPSKTKQVHR
jgi:hypothetical protein